MRRIFIALLFLASNTFLNPLMLYNKFQKVLDSSH